MTKEELPKARVTKDNGNVSAETNDRYLMIDLRDAASKTQLTMCKRDTMPDPKIVPAYELWLRRIPADQFMMGDSVGTGWNDEKPAHQVTIVHDFYIGVFPVLQKQWELVMGTNPALFTNSGDKAPVENVSYDDICDGTRPCPGDPNNTVKADSFLGRLRIKTKQHEFNLPTENQWEYACRAGTVTDLNNYTNLCSEYGQCKNLDKIAWYKENSGGHTHNVGELAPNSWGLYDMHGNVWELCYEGDGNDRSSENAAHSQTRAGNDPRLVIRGGSWYEMPKLCRSSTRCRNLSKSCRDNETGFRLCLPDIK